MGLEMGAWSKLGFVVGELHGVILLILFLA